MATLQEFLTVVHSIGINHDTLILIVIYFLMKPRLNDIKFLKTEKDKENSEPKHKVNMNKSTDDTEIIDTVLHQIINKFNADRAYLVQYHNGGHNLSGVPFSKWSITHECTRIGISKEIQFMRELSTGMLSYLHKTIVRDKEILLHSINEMISVNSGFYETMLSRGVKSFYGFGICSITGDVIGFIGLDYVKGEVSLNKDYLEQIKALSSTICGCILMDPKGCAVGISNDRN